MDVKLLQRVMNLAEKTGDRVIVVNPESGVAHAILPFDAYEDLVDGGVASLHDLEDEDDFFCDPDELGEECCGEKNVTEPVPQTTASESLFANDELEKNVEHDLELIKMAQQKEKETNNPAPIDMLEDDVNEDQYYLEPLE